MAREHIHDEEHRDPLTGEPGAHPVGVGVGAAVGGGMAGAALGTVGVTTAAGAVLGTAAGPVGAVVGAVAGGIIGGLAGKKVAESIEESSDSAGATWDTQDAFWREHYRSCPYFQTGEVYDDYGPAYRYGWESRRRYPGRRFEEVETELANGWEPARGQSTLGWAKARLAARDAWERGEWHTPELVEAEPVVDELDQRG